MHCRYGAQDNFQYNTIEQRHTPTNHALQVWGTGQHFQYNTVEQTKTHTNQPCTAGMGHRTTLQYNTVEQTKTRTNQPCTAGMGHRTTLSIQYCRTNKDIHQPTMHCRYGALSIQYSATKQTNKQTHQPTNQPNEQAKTKCCGKLR